ARDEVGSVLRRQRYNALGPKCPAPVAHGHDGSEDVLHGRVALRRWHPRTALGHHAVGRRDPDLPNHRLHLPLLAPRSPVPLGLESRRLNALRPAALVAVGMSGGEVVVETFDSRLLRGNALGDPTKRDVAVYLPPKYDPMKPY